MTSLQRSAQCIEVHKLLLFLTGEGYDIIVAFDTVCTDLPCVIWQLLQDVLAMLSLSRQIGTCITDSLRINV